MLQYARTKDGKQIELACKSNSKIYGLNKGYRQILKKTQWKGWWRAAGWWRHRAATSNFTNGISLKQKKI